MANATTRVATSIVPWGDDKKRLQPADTTATYQPGAMIGLNSSGLAVKCDDTSGVSFQGIHAGQVPVIITSGDGSSADPAHFLLVKRPWRFTMAIASASAGDEGKKLYAKDDQTVAYSGVSNSILVGFVDQVLSSTLVLVNPLYAPLNPVAVSSNVLAFAGATGVDQITFPDNLADALSFAEGSNLYLTFVTTNGSEVTKVLGPAATAATNAGGAVQITAGSGGTTSGTGGGVTITAGAGGTGSSAAGGTLVMAGGAGGSVAGAGGAVSLTGGAASAGNAAGGAASLVGGAGQGSSAGGAITITSGAAGATGVAGAVNISVGGATAGNGSAVTITGGSGAGGTASGGNVNLVPGAAVSTGVPGEVQVNSAAGLWEVNWQQFLAANVPVSGTSYPVYLATRAMRVKAVKIVCSSTSTQPTVDVTKDTSTTAPGGGTSVLTGTVQFSATANTVVSGTLTSTVATVTLAAGDRLSIKWGGTVGSITGALVNILLVPC